MNIEIDTPWHQCYVGQHVDVFKTDCVNIDPLGKVYVWNIQQKGKIMMTSNVDIHRFVVYIDDNQIIQELRCG